MFQITGNIEADQGGSMTELWRLLKISESGGDSDIGEDADVEFDGE